MTDCKHGARRRVVHGGASGKPLQAGEYCPADDPACGIRWVGLKEIMAYWASSGGEHERAPVDEPSLSGVVTDNAAAVYPLPHPAEMEPVRARYTPRRYR